MFMFKSPIVPTCRKTMHRFPGESVFQPEKLQILARLYACTYVSVIPAHFSLYVLPQQVISSSYGQEYSFWMAAAITAGHTIVLLIMLPETRGRSLTEIQRLLASSSSSSTSSPHKSMMLVQHLGIQNIKIVPAGESTR